MTLNSFIGGNSHPTIPHRFKDNPRFGDASADTQRDRGNGSRLYEVNIWMWRYGRGRPRMASIAEAERIKSERLSESRSQAAATRKQRGRCRSGGCQRRRRGGLNTLAYDIICHIIVNIIYDIIGMIWTMIS
jgi:hypothetical protein